MCLQWQVRVADDVSCVLLSVSRSQIAVTSEYFRTAKN